jgi:hypothetical protein
MKSSPFNCAPIVLAVGLLYHLPTHSCAQTSADSAKDGIYRTLDGRATVFFPSQPKHSEVTAKNADNVITQYSASSDPDKTTYFLMYLKVEDTTGYRGEEDILDRGPRPELSIWSMCETVSRATIKYRNHPCEEVQVTLPGGNAAATRRTIIVKDMVYDLLAIYPKDNANTEMNNKFFASFEFTE